MSEQEAMDLQEAELPPLSGVAFNQAFRDALAAGQSVLISGNGALFRVSADEGPKRVGSIEPPTFLPVGTKIELR